MNINLDSSSIDSEINRIEKYFATRQKDSTISVEESSQPKNLEALLVKRGYKYTPEENVVIWAKDIPFSEYSFNQKVRFVIADNFDSFQDYLSVAEKGWSDMFDYSRYSASLSKQFTEIYDGVTTMHIVGYIGDEAVCSSTLGIYFDMAHLVNISVLPEYRRQGVASEMIRYASIRAEEKNASQIYVCIDEKDKPGSALLKSLGFSPDITQKMYIKKL